MTVKNERKESENLIDQEHAKIMVVHAFVYFFLVNLGILNP